MFLRLMSRAKSVSPRLSGMRGRTGLYQRHCMQSSTDKGKDNGVVYFVFLSIAEVINDQSNRGDV